MKTMKRTNISYRFTIHELLSVLVGLVLLFTLSTCFGPGPTAPEVEQAN